MNVGLVSLQSSLINYSARQHVFKPFVLLAAGIALAIISGLFIGLMTRGGNRRSYHMQPATVNSTRVTPSLYPRAGNLSQVTGVRGREGSSSPTDFRGMLRVNPYRNQTYCISPTVQDLELNPCEYIKKLAEAIRSEGLKMAIGVHFRKDDDPVGTAAVPDAGGPTRQFFSLLFQSLKTQFSSVGTKPADFYAHTNKSATLLVPQGQPTNDPTSSIFDDIGTVMMYVYFSSKSPLIGPVFHGSIFAAMLSLDDQEIDTPFAQLSDATKFKICKTLINMQQASGENFEDYVDVLKFLDKGAQFQKEDIENVNVKNFYAIHALNEDSRDFLGSEGDEFNLNAVTLDWSAIENDKGGFFSKYWNYFLQLKTDSLGTIELTLFPIHTMAKAMKEASKELWTIIRFISEPSTVAASSQTADPQIEAAKRLQRKIQGVLDREILVSKIKVNARGYGEGVEERANQQVDWIKAWILDPTTSDILIEGLLTFWTGSSCVDWDKVQNIIVSVQRGLLPGASTCGRMLYVSDSYSKKNDRGELGQLHNHTKEGYYQVLNKISGEYTHC